MRSYQWALTQQDWCPYEKGDAPGKSTWRKDGVRTQREAAISQPRRGLRRNEPRDT